MLVQLGWMGQSKKWSLECSWVPGVSYFSLGSHLSVKVKGWDPDTCTFEFPLFLSAPHCTLHVLVFSNPMFQHMPITTPFLHIIIRDFYQLIIA